MLGFGLTGFRSYWSDVQYFGPMGKVTLLAGQNNAGKSNAIRFVRSLSSTQQVNTFAEDLDRPQVERATPFTYALAVRVSDEDIRTVSKNSRMNQGDVAALLRRMTSNPKLHATDDDLFWFEYSDVGAGVGRHIDADYSPRFLKSLIDGLDHHTLSQTALALSGSSSSNPSENAQAIIKLLDPRSALPSVRTVNAFRELNTENIVNELGIDAPNLTTALLRLANPDSAADFGNRRKFERINKFLQGLLDDPTATLHVSSNAQSILVERGELVLPLEHLGTGVQQVVVLAAATTVLNDTLICIEEPEVHLHPLMQRKLIRYLHDNTENEYLVATHSAHVLDTDRADIFHLEHNSSDGTSVRHALQPAEVARVCADLGYRPSDILQSNAVLWVEGPSDRIYLRHWISLLAPDLVEGIDFSIMFYAGRLLSHLSPDDPSVNEFISLRRLNRSLMVMIDSDKRRASDDINATKQRVVSSFEDSDDVGFAWVTDGRTIENYVPRHLLIDALTHIHSSADFLNKEGKWSDVFENSHKRPVDKVAIAEHIASHWAELTDKTLLQRVQRVVSLIQNANGIY